MAGLAGLEGSLLLQEKFPFINTPLTKVQLVVFHFSNISVIAKIQEFSFPQLKEEMAKIHPQLENLYWCYFRHCKITTKSHCLVPTERDVVSNGFVFTKAN